MTLKQLAQQAKWEDLREVMATLYPDDKGVENGGYQYALEQLRRLEPQDDGEGFYFTLTRVTDDTYKEAGIESYVDVSHRKPDSEESYAADFTPWANCLAMEIDPAAIEEHGELGTLAHILWEITFHGYDADEQAEKVSEILDYCRAAVAEIENGTAKTYSWEEVKALAALEENDHVGDDAIEFLNELLADYDAAEGEPLDEAEMVLNEHAEDVAKEGFEGEVLHLSPDDSRQFAEVLLNPPEPNEALRELARRFKDATEDEE